ncbi:MAG: class I SAM-dependent methyltransferase [Candidatus Goldbacteria bacterium]|nr:class I SAM-dependent methyltransferase [Candidatus Goldiibacteriota bacterium]HPD18032.1 class I SAM-dependent methyltransferase [Candidatus Goldiibacteriota bacterium]
MEIKRWLKRTVNKLFWDSYAIVYDDITKYYDAHKQLNCFVMNFMSKKIKNGVVFDAGCGTGELSILLSSKYKVLAGDFSEPMLKRLKTKIKKNKIKNITPKMVDLNEKLVFRDRKFDAVINVHSLFMLEDIFFTLEEFCRVVKKNGYLIIAHHKPIKIGVIIKKIIEENGIIKGFFDLLHLFFAGMFNVILGFLHRKMYGEMQADKIIKFVKIKKCNIICSKSLYNDFDDVLIFKKR